MWLGLAINALYVFAKKRIENTYHSVFRFCKQQKQNKKISALWSQNLYFYGQKLDPDNIKAYYRHSDYVFIYCINTFI